MAASSSHSVTGFEPAFMMDGTPNSYAFYNDHVHRRSSVQDDMTTIDEDRIEDFSDRHPFGKDGVLVTEDPVPSHVPTTARNPSLLRRLSTRLRTDGSVYRSRPSQRREYASIGESHSDVVPVDLTSLGGLGIELRERSAIHAVRGRPEVHHDTAYRGATDSASAPSFNEFRRRTLGSGMIIGAELRRDLSRADEEASTGSASAREDQIQRMRTVRQVGRSLAEERGQIIAYNEGVDLSLLDGSDIRHTSSESVDEIGDLSLLEGSRIRHQQSTTFEGMNLNRASTVPDTQSYYFPSDPDIPNWKPIFMQPPYIIFLVVIAFGLAGFQEFICQKSLEAQRETPKTALLAFDSVNEVSVWWFFVWKYLPTGITILYAMMFSLMDFEIRRLEPYYQLSKPHGARASASINLDHLTTFQYFVPFNAARLGQWAVLASTVANIIVATIAPAVQNPSVDFQPNPGCVSEEGPQLCPDGSGMKRFWVLIDPNWSRALTAAYILVGCILIFLLVQLRRKSGLLSDPKGIAGIASMATKSHILQDFRGLDLATRGDIHKRLARRTYVLYKHSIWQGEYVSEHDRDDFQDSERRLHSPHPIMLRLEAGAFFIIFMIFCLGAVPAICVTKARWIPNTLPWLPILVATILKMVWSTFEADVRLIEPFYQLSKGNCTPKNSLTLDYQSKVYGLMPVAAALNGHFLVALVGMSSVLLDVLSVTIGSFSVDSNVFLRGKDADSKTGERPADSDETYVSFWVSFGLSMAILVLAIGVACLVYHRRRHPFLPRSPSTIAAVLSFIYSSKMLTDFIDTERLDNKGMEARLTNLNKRYALGWFRGRDGKVHCAIDEEPILSRYIHGTPYSNAISGPLQDHETFYYP